jgi:organic hydroperoxide reductase OsmC/OhrA
MEPSQRFLVPPADREETIAFVGENGEAVVPHRYHAHTSAGPEGDIMLLGDGLRPLRTAAAAAFGGPGDRWSPETLLVAAVADCFVLTFRAVARAAQFSWESLDCEADGVLDRVERVPQFTRFTIRALLRVRPGTKEDDGRRVLARAKEHCLISNSLKGSCAFEGHIEVAESTEAA